MEKTKLLRVPKSDRASNNYREQGNKLYAKDEFVDAVEMYNKSLCFAESPLNLALAYANRSAVCFALKMYLTCLENIELAKTHDAYPPEKMDKLIERAEKCHRMIAEGAETDESMMKLSGEEYLKLSHPPHPKLPYIADCLDVKYSRKFGRHVMTKKILKPGDIICIESPFSKYLKSVNKYKHCINCVDYCFLSLIPCPLSTSAMFCSTKCIEEASESFYKYEVDIIDKIHQIFPNNRSAVEVFFQALKACNGDLELLKQVTESNVNNPDLTILDVDDPLEQINIFRAIDALQTLENERGSAENMIRAKSIKDVANLFLRHTKLAELISTEEDKEFFRNFLLKHSHVAAINFHAFGNVIGKREDLHSSSSSTGSFPFLSLINHACNGNVYRMSDNQKVYLIVIRVIEPEEQLFDTYGYYFDQMDKQSRQRELREKYLFDCECYACRKNLANNIPMRLKNRKDVMNFLSFRSEMEKYDVKIAKNLFKTICDAMIRNKSYYPCCELISFETMTQRCFILFFMSKLMLHLFKWKSVHFN